MTYLGPGHQGAHPVPLLQLCGAVLVPRSPGQAWCTFVVIVVNVCVLVIMVLILVKVMGATRGESWWCVIEIVKMLVMVQVVG